jgi:hypothetical protein
MPVASPVAVPVALPVTLQTSAIKTMLYIFHAQHLCEARMMQFLSEKGVVSKTTQKTARSGGFFVHCWKATIRRIV